jgi:hypothetical protein
MALGGPPVYPSTGVWVGIAREITAGGARTGFWLCGSCKRDWARWRTAQGSVDCDLVKMVNLCNLCLAQAQIAIADAGVRDVHGHVVHDIAWVSCV